MVRGRFPCTLHKSGFKSNYQSKPPIEGYMKNLFQEDVIARYLDPSADYICVCVCPFTNSMWKCHSNRPRCLSRCTLALKFGGTKNPPIESFGLTDFLDFKIGLIVAVDSS